MLEDSLGITRIKRDEHGRIEEVEDPAGRKTDYTWGAHGERKSIATPDRKRTEYQYDNFMRLTGLAVAGAEPGDESIVRYIYDANGRLSQKEMPEGIKTTYLYNSKGLLESLKHEDREGILDEYTDMIGQQEVTMPRQENTNLKQDDSWLLIR